MQNTAFSTCKLYRWSQPSKERGEYLDVYFMHHLHSMPKIVKPAYNRLYLLYTGKHCKGTKVPLQCFVFDWFQFTHVYTSFCHLIPIVLVFFANFTNAGVKTFCTTLPEGVLQVNWNKQIMCLFWIAQRTAGVPPLPLWQPRREYWRFSSRVYKPIFTALSLHRKELWLFDWLIWLAQKSWQGTLPP